MKPLLQPAVGVECSLVAGLHDDSCRMLAERACENDTVEMRGRCAEGIADRSLIFLAEVKTDDDLAIGLGGCGADPVPDSRYQSLIGVGTAGAGFSCRK